MANATTPVIQINEGKVGIGVIDPQAKLEVMGASATPADGNEIISVTNTTGGSKLLLGVVENNYGWIQSAEGGTLRNLLLNPSGGNVGIGTTLPGTKLAFGGFGSIWVNNDSTNPFGMDTVGGELRLFVGTGSVTYQMKFGKYNGTTFTSHMTIGDDGSNPNFIGIGTDSPDEKLDIQDGYLKFNGGDYGIKGSNSLTYNAVSDHYFLTSGSTKVTIKANGQVGIGATTFENSWSGYSVLKLGADNSFFSNTTSSTGSALFIAQNVYNDGNVYRYIRTNESGLVDMRDGKFNFLSAPSGSAGATATMTNRFTILQGGNVGIGTTSPTSLLHILGDSSSADYMVQLYNTKYNSTNTTGESSILFGWGNHSAARLTAFKEGTVNRTGFKIVGEAGFNVPSLIATFKSTGDVQFNNYGAGYLKTDASGNITAAGAGQVGPFLPLAGGTMTGTIVGPTAGSSSANPPALEVVASGTGNEQASIAIQQKTAEGDTIIFADYEPHVEWGISTENNANEIQFTAGNAAGSLGTKTLYNNAGSARTAYIKFNHTLGNGNTQIGGTLSSVGYTGTTGSFSDQVDINGFTNNKGLSFRTGFVPTNVGIMAKAIGTGNRDGLAIFGYNGVDFVVDNGNYTAMRVVGVTGSGKGNVGIGTLSPSAKLQVAGSTTYNSDTAQALRVCDEGDISKGVHIGFDTTLDAGIIQAGDFGVSYRNLLLNPNVGRVGIGRISPVSILEIGDDTPTLTVSDIGNNYNVGDVQSVLHLSGRWNSGTPNPATDNYSDARLVLKKDSGNGTGGSSLTIETSANGAGGLTPAIVINKIQNIRFNAYGAGTLVTDSNGNITTAIGTGPFLPLAGGTLTGALSGTSASFTGLVTTKLFKIINNVSISNSYVRVLEIDEINSQLSSQIRVSMTAHGNGHVATCSAIISVGHFRDIMIESNSLSYTQVTLKVESNNNGQYTLSVKSTSSNAANYQFTIEGLTKDLSIALLPSSSQTGTTLEHVTNFGTNVTSIDVDGGNDSQFKFGGNVGIGAISQGSPASQLHIESDNPIITLQRNNNGNASGAINFRGSDNVVDWQIGTNQVVGLGFEFNYANSNKMVIESNGAVGINVTNPQEKLEVDGNIFVTLKFGNLTAGSKGVQFEAPTTATQTCRFDSDEMRFFAGGGAGEVFTMLNSTGAATFTNTVTATNFILSSDERLKENIKILEPKVISAEWKSFNAKDDDSYRTGVIAQELEVKHPEFVETNDKGFKSVKYIDLLISKIAELEHRIKQLEK